MKAKKDSAGKILSPDLLYTDEPQIIQNYPTYQQSSTMPSHDFANLSHHSLSSSKSDMMMPTNGSYNNPLNGLMNINHEQQQTHLELSSFV
jgi:hypothetical protein